MRGYLMFTRTFHQPEAECPHLLDITFSLLSSDESSSLIVSFFEAVIRVWYGVGMGDKSPGLDRFNFSFFKNCWDVLN